MKQVGKKFPRIYSIHTIGVRNHNNADYLIHPLRTDFTGESTTGKSLVGADLPQLILTAGQFYKSATPPKGNVPREYNTIPLPGATFAYAFMNIEVEAGEFIVMGVQIKSSKRILIPFIIQGERYLGYEQRETPVFKNLKSIVRFKDFLIKGDEIPTIENLKDSLDGKSYFLKSFSNNKSEYHKLLFDNGILHLDLSNDENLQRQFASTIQSLSRGEDIETQGTKFKKFLFHYDNQVADRFKRESEEIEQSHRSFQSNTQKHFSFTEKKERLKKLLELKKAKEESFEYRLRTETAYSYQKVQEQEAKLESARRAFFQAELEILAVKDKKIQMQIQAFETQAENKRQALSRQRDEFTASTSSYEDYEKEVNVLKSILPKLEAEKDELKSGLEKIEQVERWIKEYSTLNEVTAQFDKHLEINAGRTKLSELNTFLGLKGLIADFEDSQYSKSSIHEATEFYLVKKNELSHQIEGIRKLIGIIELQEPDSFAGWALGTKRKLSELQEAVLFQFASTPITKSDAGKNYIPEPEDFIESLKEVEETESDFVINLSGLYYHIAKRPNYIFANPDALQEEVMRIGKDFQKKINGLQEQFGKIENLQKELIQSFKFSGEHFQAYRQRQDILSYKIDESFLRFTSTLFSEAILLYELDVKKEDEQKVRTLSAKKNAEYSEQLRLKISSEEKMNRFLTEKNLAAGQVNVLSVEIADLESKIDLLRNTDLFAIETNFIAWKSNGENPFDGNHEQIFQKNKAVISDNKDFKSLDETLLTLVGRSGGLENEIRSIKQLIPHLQSAFERQNTEYKQYFREAFTGSRLAPNISDEDLDAAKNNQLEANKDYTTNYDLIVQHFNAELIDNPVMANHEYHFNELLFQLIPHQLITNKERPEESLLNDIENILADLNQKIQDLNDEETRKIHSTIHSLKEIVEKHIGDLEKIQTHFKEFKLANHHSVTLEFGAADDFDLGWIKKFKEDSQEASFLKSFGFKTDESAYGILERIFKKYCPAIKDAKANEILDPFNYYNARAKLIDTTGTEKSATGGTGYGLLALIGIAKLSVVEGKKNIRDIKKGLRILPVDEVAGLGGNFEMLYELAQTLDYQIFTMTISANDLSFQDGKQIYYEFIGSANPEKPYINEGVHACFSKHDATFDIENYFSDKIFRLPVIHNVG